MKPQTCRYPIGEQRFINQLIKRFTRLFALSIDQLRLSSLHDSRQTRLRERLHAVKGRLDKPVTRRINKAPFTFLLRGSGTVLIIPDVVENGFDHQLTLTV